MNGATEQFDQHQNKVKTFCSGVLARGRGSPDGTWTSPPWKSTLPPSPSPFPMKGLVKAPWGKLSASPGSVPPTPAHFPFICSLIQHLQAPIVCQSPCQVLRHRDARHRPYWGEGSSVALFLSFQAHTRQGSLFREPWLLHCFFLRPPTHSMQEQWLRKSLSFHLHYRILFLKQQQEWQQPYLPRSLWLRLIFTCICIFFVHKNWERVGKGVLPRNENVPWANPQSAIAIANLKSRSN